MSLRFKEKESGWLQACGALSHSVLLIIAFSHRHAPPPPHDTHSQHSIVKIPFQTSPELDGVIDLHAVVPAKGGPPFGQAAVILSVGCGCFVHDGPDTARRIPEGQGGPECSVLIMTCACSAGGILEATAHCFHHHRPSVQAQPVVTGLT